MRTRRPGRLSAAATRRLLDGGDGPPPLAQILAAATAPTTVAELRGESAARAAFRSSPHPTPLPHDPPRRSPLHAASTFMIAKAVAAVALAASTAGSIALATTSTPADPHALITSEAATTDGVPPSAVVLATPGPVAVIRWGVVLTRPWPAAQPGSGAARKLGCGATIAGLRILGTCRTVIRDGR
jgi:hypothetical protein